MARKLVTAYKRIRDLNLRSGEMVAEMARARQTHGLTAPGRTLPQDSEEPSERGETDEHLGDLVGKKKGRGDGYGYSVRVGSPAPVRLDGVGACDDLRIVVT